MRTIENPATYDDYFGTGGGAIGRDCYAWRLHPPAINTQGVSVGLHFAVNCYA